MEFFEFADLLTTQDEIRNKVSIDTLPFFCEEIEAVDEAEELGRVIFRHWGRFHLRQEDVMGGVRFSVPDCPNALAWTVTTGYLSPLSRKDCPACHHQQACARC